ncbi:MAG: MarR family transcriptional regulator [Cytophagia bacterium]|nr:MAG: MarR family transcriptional regulator [Cytophagales bacterium]TAG07075.1 MAG: MarR family transcriptional regulator [Cytophagia bacterium]TAG42175.1 MAG: MarR family transcriptional regulator [Cytophagia bacterium]
MKEEIIAYPLPKNLKREQSIDYQIKATWHAIARMYNAEANQYNLTVSVGYILLNIDIDEGTPATKIAPLLGLEARSITRTLKNMEEEGFIKKIQDENDRRFFRIFLTDHGKKAREVARKSVKKFNQIVYQSIEPEKMKTFFEVIQKINHAIDENNNIANKS